MLHGAVTIERKLPIGGYVTSPDQCARLQARCAFAFQPELRDCGSEFTCKPFEPIPADQFCAGRSAGQSCTVQLSYQGMNERHEGICTAMVEEMNYYFRGHQIAKRDVIRCEPRDPVRRIYTTIERSKEDQ